MHKNGDRITVRGISGCTYEYVWKDTPCSGAMKNVFFSPDRKYVVAYFKESQDANAIDRLQNLVTTYRSGIFDGEGGEYWKKIYCWPTDIVRDGDRIAIIVPAYHKEFFFTYGSSKLDIRNGEKEGKWFTNPWHRYCNLDAREVGDWRCYFDICLLLARGVRRMHMAGLAHSDLSYKNVLVDPVSRSAAIIDIDGLVVPGKYPPEVVGTPDFIAPEVYATMHLPKNDPSRKLPCINTDLHALAVLIYMYLLCRHPLEGKKIWDLEDEQNDKTLAFGEKAVFIEDPQNRINRYTVDWVKKNQPKSRFPYMLPWMDLDRLPYTVLGPYLSKLFDMAFVKGLHNPTLRPKAFEWEEALIQTMDLMLPCQNPKCKQKWFVYDNSASNPRCPFCGISYKIPLPVLNLYNRGSSSYKPTGTRIMVYNGTRLYLWHANQKIARNEKLSTEQKKSIACFQFHNNKWYLRNERARGMMMFKEKTAIPVGTFVELNDGVQILLDGEDSRMIYVQMVNR